MSGMLPKGWMEVSIGEIAFVSLGKTPSKKDYLSNGSLKVIKFRDVNNGVVDFFNDKTGFVRVDEAVVSSMTELKMWDVLTTSAAHSGENIGKKTAIVTELPEKFERVFFTGELLNVRIPNHFLGFEIVSKMIYYFLSSEAGYKGIQKAVAGVHLTQGRAKGILFPLPPLNEQKRIVAKLDAIMPRIDSAKKRLEKIPAILKRFRQSVLTDAVTGKLTEKWREEHPEAECIEVERLKNTDTESKRKQSFKKSLKSEMPLQDIPDEWFWIKLSQTGEMGRGKSRHRPRNAPHLFGGIYPFIQTGDIANSNGLIKSHKQTYSEEGLQQSKLWPEKTICITIAANIADSAILTYPACFPDSVVGIVVNEKICETRFLEFFIRTVRENLSFYAPATAQKNINLSILNDVLVPLPPLDEQKEIVRQVDKLFALADKVEEHYQKARARVEALAQSVLAKAFRGELVPQDPDDEPAENLLQRIREEKAKMETELKTVSRRARETRKNGAKTQRAGAEEKQAREP